MHQLGEAMTFAVPFTAAQIGKSLTDVKVTVYGPSLSPLVSDQDATPIGDGLQGYTLSGTHVTAAGVYLAVFKTGDGSVDQKWLYASQEAGAAWVQDIDAAVSTRLAASSYTAPPSVGAIDTQLSGTHGSGLWQTANPADPTLCRVYGYEFASVGGEPVGGRKVRVTLAGAPQTTSSVILESQETVTYSGSGGYWYVDLVQGKQYRVVITEAEVDQTITVPAQPNVDFRTLL